MDPGSAVFISSIEEAGVAFLHPDTPADFFVSSCYIPVLGNPLDG
jgi:hypothetical protein